MNKIYSIRVGLFPIDGTHGVNYDFNQLENAPITIFLRTEDIEFLNIDGIEIFKKYQDDNTAFIFLDPPYLQSCNSYYQNPDLNIYEYICNNPIKKMKSYIMLVLENNWIIKLLFSNDKIKCQYDKKYEVSKKKTTHMIITNFQFLRNIYIQHKWQLSNYLIQTDLLSLF